MMIYQIIGIVVAIVQAVVLWHSGDREYVVAVGLGHLGSFGYQ
jgi:uncharacterized membrane protein YqiK